MKLIKPTNEMALVSKRLSRMYYNFLNEIDVDVKFGECYLTNEIRDGELHIEVLLNIEDLYCEKGHAYPEDFHGIYENFGYDLFRKGFFSCPKRQKTYNDYVEQGMSPADAFIKIADNILDCCLEELLMCEEDCNCEGCREEEINYENCNKLYY